MVITKLSNCIVCGLQLYINKYASSKTCKCENCKQNEFLNNLDYYKNSKTHTKQIKLKVCQICGSVKNLFGNCENDFCKLHNYLHFRSLIKYFGFDKSKLGTIEVENEFNRVRNTLYDLYWNENLSSTDIAKLFNYKSTPTNITQKFFKNYLNIPVKSVSYSVNENIILGRLNITSSNKYKSQWHLSWNNKYVFLRSSYELDYAKELDKLKIDYDVESIRIRYFNTLKNKIKYAIPDFYLPDSNTLVEIKSNWTFDKQEMIDKFTAYRQLGYNCKLILEHIDQTNIL